MISTLGKKVKALLNQGHKRTVKARKHIMASLLIKGFSICIGFYMVPLTLGYVQKEQYGIWLTLSSVIAWFSFFDIGLGNGLRNKLAESLAENDLIKAKSYISSTYAILGLIFGTVLLFFFGLTPFLDWTKILNTSPDQFEELRLVAIVTFTFFCLNFILQLLYTIFLADQRPSFTGLFSLMSNFISLAIIFVLSKTTDGSLFKLALVMGGVPFVIVGIASIFFYTGEYKAIRPSIHYIKKAYFKDLVSLGVKFFLVSIAGLVIFSTDNMIIIQLFGPAEVPPYSIAHTYFDLAGKAFSIVSLPFWSAYTEAWVKEDKDWIIATNKSLIKVWCLVVAGGLFMLLISQPFYNFWVPEVEIPMHLSVLMLIFVLMLAFGNIFVMFINGVGKVQLQLLGGLAGAIINIPLSIFFAKYCGFGTAGVIMASIVCLAYGPFIAPIQFRKIINGTAKGIWNK